MPNTQRPEKKIRHFDPSSLVEIHSIFHTIQGEGIFAGCSSVFVRLAGCNLQCPECDTEYTDKRERMSPTKVLNAVQLAAKGTKTNLVVITGGEPFRQPIGPLIACLISGGYTVQVETNGTLFDSTVNYDDDNLFIVCSPKTGHVNKELYPHIDAFKYVGGCNELSIPRTKEIKHLQLEDYSLMEDGLPKRALGHTAQPHLFRPDDNFSGWIFLQPIDRKNDVLNQFHQQAVVESCLKNGYTLCLQIHKIIEVE